MPSQLPLSFFRDLFPFVSKYPNPRRALDEYIYIYIIFYQLNNQSGINTGKPFRNRIGIFSTRNAPRSRKKKKKSAKRATGPKERQFAMASPVIIPKSNVKITRSHENI